jgi:putative ABC transport system ATP-binding protein
MALIIVENITRTYKLGGETFDALKDVSLVVEAGEFLAITGPSGSGKSTLANIIGGLDAPSLGSVSVDGVVLSKARDNELSRYRNRHIGFVFQSFNLQAHETALENVSMPLVLARMKRRDRIARASECLAAVGLADRMHHKPAELSGGQRQRVAIARALAVKPSIIIADEPTGNLDSSRGAEIMTLLKKLNNDGITLIIITHDSGIAAQADRVVTIKDGHLTVRKG